MQLSHMGSHWETMSRGAVSFSLVMVISVSLKYKTDTHGAAQAWLGTEERE